MSQKSNFYEASVRIPLQVAWPGHLPNGHCIDAVISLVDLTATLVEVAGAPQMSQLDGSSLLSLMRGDAVDWKNEAFPEYLAHGVARPMAMLRTGGYKFNYSLGESPELCNLQTDANEFHNLDEGKAHQSILKTLEARLLSH